MKNILSFFIFLLCFFPVSLLAVTFTAHRDAPEGMTIQKFEFIKGSLRYSKSSNFFDLKEDLRLGTMTAADPTQVKPIQKEIDDFHQQLQRASKELKKIQDIELSDLRTDDKYAPAILVGGHKLAPRTVAYKTAQQLLLKLLALEWKLLKGISVTADGQVEKFSEGRKISTVPKHKYFRCSQKTGVEVCQHLDQLLYLR